MKRKVIFFVILTLTLTGCASIVGPKEPPRCNGKNTRPLNRDKWNWDNENIIPQRRIVKPVQTPTILNTLESEKATISITPNKTTLNPISHETRLNNTVEVTREK
ncbi:type IV secretion system protein VirB7 [Bartonella sp. CB169]|uniref:type IV secretion system protein VirB7 n=1 Tax=Bartonella sp. CB169 TaxID=3112257 RepID=UPI00300E52C3